MIKKQKQKKNENIFRSVISKIVCINCFLETFFSTHLTNEKENQLENLFCLLILKEKENIFKSM